VVSRLFEHILKCLSLKFLLSSHLDTPSDCKLSAGGYFCPQCNSKYCELPVECKACGLTLASAPHLARSYHHLFPVEPFSELPFHPEDENSPCYGCQRNYSVSKDKHVGLLRRFYFAINLYCFHFYFRFTSAAGVCKYFVMIVTSLFTRLCIHVLAVHQTHQLHLRSSKANLNYIIPFTLKEKIF
jgi:transcription factor Ssl1